MSRRTYTAGVPAALALTALLATAGPAAAAATGTTATPPGAPTSVSAVAGNASIAVSWHAPTSTGGSAITAYTAACTTGSTTKTAKVGGSVLTATVTGLTNGSAYTCKVTATNAAGTGPASTATSAVTPVGPPAAPKKVLATTKSGAITVKWTAPTTGGSAITGYAVACTSTDGGAALSATAAATAKTVTISGLPSNKTYSCKVTASNAKGTSPAGVSADDVEHAVITTAGGSATLHLPVAAGQRATLVGSGDALTSDSCGDLAIHGADGTELTDGCLYKSETAYVETSSPFAAAATATGVLTAPTGATGSAELAAYAYTDVTVPLTPGAKAVAITLTAPGQLAYGTFTGRAGEVVSSTLVGSTMSGSFDLRDPAGDEIGYGGFYTGSDGFIDATTLPSAGPYQIVVSPGSYATGTTSLRLYDVPANTGTLTVGAPAQLITLTTPGENATRTFTGTAGQSLTATFTGNTVEGLLDVLDATGNEVAYSYLYSGGASGSFSFTLPKAGTYRVVVDATYDHVGKVSVAVH